jgi:hypothetical protein
MLRKELIEANFMIFTQTVRLNVVERALKAEGQAIAGSQPD